MFNPNEDLFRHFCNFIEIFRSLFWCIEKAPKRVEKGSLVKKKKSGKEREKTTNKFLFFNANESSSSFTPSVTFVRLNLSYLSHLVFIFLITRLESVWMYVLTTGAGCGWKKAAAIEQNSVFLTRWFSPSKFFRRNSIRLPKEHSFGRNVSFLTSALVSQRRWLEHNYRN